MGRLGEWLANSHRTVEVPAEGGRRYRVVARRKGIAESEPLSSMFVPGELYLPWTLFRYVRWNLLYRRHWLVEVHRHDRGDASGRLEEFREAATRHEAFEVLESAAESLRQRERRQVGDR